MYVLVIICSIFTRLELNYQYDYLLYYMKITGRPTFYGKFADEWTWDSERSSAIFTAIWQTVSFKIKNLLWKLCSCRKLTL